MFSFAKRRTGALQQARGRAAAARQEDRTRTWQSRASFSSGADAGGNRPARRGPAPAAHRQARAAYYASPSCAGAAATGFASSTMARIFRRFSVRRARAPSALAFSGTKKFLPVVRTAAETLPSWQKVTNSGPGLTLAAARIFSCYNSSIGKTRIKMQTFRIIDENPSHENAASKLVLAAVRFFILAVLIRFKQHSAPPYEATFLPFFSLPLSARRCAMI